MYTVITQFGRPVWKGNLLYIPAERDKIDLPDGKTYRVIDARMKLTENGESHIHVRVTETFK